MNATQTTRQANLKAAVDLAGQIQIPASSFGWFVHPSGKVEANSVSIADLDQSERDELHLKDSDVRATLGWGIFCVLEEARLAAAKN
jgi:hypothetical protein